ncbi:MAG: transporter [Chloroflexi bacterium]|nr:transporter [Chloroflexota bacterium]OJW00822.1 MAG: transporter [Chloroflexi bacterium 54-19]
MISILAQNPILLLFLVAAVGYAIGQIKIGKTGLGIAAVLFAGLGIGALSPDLKLPEIVYQIGLVLFVYTIGLSSGPSFVAAFKNKGWRDNGLVAGLLALAALMTVGFQGLFQLKPTMASGMFAGSVTNTPALAAILEKVTANNSTLPKSALDQLLAEPVVGYSVAYPMGVIGTMLAIFLLQRIWKINYHKEAEEHPELGLTGQVLLNQTILVTNPQLCGQPLQDLLKTHGWDVIFGRIRHENSSALAQSRSELCVGDLISATGTEPEIARVVAEMGELSEVRLELDRSELDYRRIFVSNQDVIGHSLKELNLAQQQGALVTRVRRGDHEFLPHADTRLQLGDRVRVVTQRSRMGSISSFFGDSYQHLAEINIFTFSLGIILGMLIGLIPIPFPGGLSIKLGIAGGPLVVALVFGVIGRSGPLVWTLPYNANLTLRQLGIILFLAGVGTRAGYPFITTVTQDSGLYLFIGGAIITFVVVLLGLFIGYKVFKIPFGVLTGIIGGMQTQPAVLSFSLEQSKNDLPNLGYATVYPIATIVKILLAQILIFIL